MTIKISNNNKNTNSQKKLIELKGIYVRFSRLT